MSGGDHSGGGGSSAKHQPLIMPSSHGHAEEDGEGSWLVSYADMMTLLVGFFVILMTMSKVDENKFDAMRQAATKEFGGTYKQPYGDTLDRIRTELNKLGLGDQFVLKQTPVGVDISFLGTVFFELGSPDIKLEGKSLLSKLIPLIQAEPEKFNLVVEGHTDDIPISHTAVSEIRSNWELSSLRACRVLESFELLGFPKGSLTAIGYGDSKPIVPNRDKAGNPIPRNQSQNRRVVIKLINRQEPKALANDDEEDEIEAEEGGKAAE